MKRQSDANIYFESEPPDDEWAECHTCDFYQGYDAAEAALHHSQQTGHVVDLVLKYEREVHAPPIEGEET